MQSSRIDFWTFEATSLLFVHVSEGKVHDVNILDRLVPEPGAFYVMDRAYLISPACIYFTFMVATLKCVRNPSTKLRRDPVEVLLTAPPD